MPTIDHLQADVQAPLLQSCVNASIDLALTFKQLHWNIQGPKFQPIHEFLDVVIEHARSAADELAERLVTVGAPAAGQRSELGQSLITQIESGFIRDDRVIELAVVMLTEVTLILRDAQSKLSEIDAVSEDLVIGILAEYEKNLWMMRSHLG